MRIAQEYRRQELPERSVPDSTVKQWLYWIIVFLAFISVVCIGVIIVHWSITDQVVSHGR